MINTQSYTADTLAFVNNYIATMESIPIPGLCDLGVNAVAVIVLQNLQPKGSSCPTRIMRMVMQVLQFTVTSYMMSVPISPCTAVVTGCAFSVTREWWAIRLRTCKIAWRQEEDQRTAGHVEQRVKRQQRLTALRTKVQTQRHLTPKQQRLKLQLAAEERMQETRACVSPDSTTILKVFAKVFRWHEHTLAELAPGSSEAVLRVITAYDHNGSFNIPDYREFTVLRRLAMRYIIYERRVSCVNDINQAIDWVRSEKNKTIKLLWVCAHGCPQGLELAEEGLVPVHTLQEINFSKLDSRAAVWLHSCRTGISPGDGQLSPAEWMKLGSSPSQRIFAPLADTCASSFELLNVNSCSATIYGINEKKLCELEELEKKGKDIASLGQGCLLDSKPIVIEPRFVPTVQKFLRWRARQSEQTGIVQIILRAFNCCRAQR